MSDQISHYENKLKYEIDAWDLFTALEKDENIIVIDARYEETYEREHIPSAINIPHRTMSEKTTAHLIWRDWDFRLRN